jgi:hypothetical protein
MPRPSISRAPTAPDGFAAAVLLVGDLLVWTWVLIVVANGGGVWLP